MKFVKIYPHKVGLVFRKGNFIKTLTEGGYWLRFGDEVKVYDMTQEFTPPCELNILTNDADFNKMVEVVEVKDNEIVLQFQNGNFKRVLAPGRYPIWKDVVKYMHQYINLNEIEVAEDIDRKLLFRPALINYIRVHVVESYEEGLLYVDGKYIKRLTPGDYYFWKNDKTVAVLKADLRQQLMEISGQEILTKDKAAVRINFYAQYKMVDIDKALVAAKDAVKQLYIVLQLSLREYIGTLALDELLAKKEDVTPYIMADVSQKAAALGMEVSTCGIRDIILPGDMKDIMNQVLVAQKKAQANTIARREETASTRSLLNTAKLIEENEMLFKLKEMEYVEKIAEKINNITLSGGSQVVDQLREIFVAGK
ncbi:MAG TPA: slipin family protein [Bacteroidetes bacterium]|nr:slipin family protein [Bacteroidota bacterium]